MIYLCRHGQTVFNREHRIQGQQDSELTPLGRGQARDMAERLHSLTAADPGPWRLQSSPLGRARATAEIIGARLGLAVALDARLMEVSVGAWEGQLRSALAGAHPDAFAGAGWVFQGPGGETYADLMARVAEWLAEQDEDSRVIVVSHGVAGRLIRGAYAALSPTATLALDIPQDALFRLSDGQIERIECAGAGQDPAP